MKKISIAIATGILLFFLFPLFHPSVSAVAPLPRLPEGNTSLLGQSHAYSVTFRGNGEAVILMRATFTNASDQPITELSFRIPNIIPKDLLTYQVSEGQTCLRYSPLLPGQETATAPCLQYDESQMRGYPGNMTFQKTESTFEGDTVTIPLLAPVQPDRTGNILLSYRAFGYAKKNVFGVYRYAFETLKVNDAIQNLTVGISVDSELVLSGAKGKTNYRFFEETQSLAASSVGKTAPLVNARYGDLFSMIGQGGIVKNTTNLAPLESYTVRGKYAVNAGILYAGEIGLTILIILTFIAFLIFLIKKGVRRFSSKQNAFGAPMKKNQGTKVLYVFVAGFVSSVLIIGYTILLTYFLRTVLPTFPSDVEGLIGILSLLVSLGVYTLCIIGPPLYFGITVDAITGLGAFGATIVFLIFNSLVALIIASLLRVNTSSRIMPMMEIPMKAGVSSGSDQPAAK
jgi:hypothetical protein